jgi:ribosomal protein L40E
MQNEELYPELIDYIYDYQCKFMNADEFIISGKFRHVPKDSGGTYLMLAKSKLNSPEDDRIKSMLADGFDAFQSKVVSRIYEQHKHELALNLCPKCGKIARKPMAKQCRFCFYDWH